MADTPTSGNDILNGTSEPNTIDGLEGDDIIHGGAGPDTLSGGAGIDRLYGGSGDDVLDGGEGDDIFNGGAGTDIITGGLGADRIDVGSGDDYVSGGAGDDLLRTGSGDDVVAYDTPDIGDDIISDFKPGHDVIDLSALTGITNVSDLEIKQVGKDVLITSSLFTGSITVNQVTVAEIMESNSILTPCFVRGTLVKTPRGEIPVEALSIGDDVVTLDGSARPIKWIGRRAFSTRFIRKSSRITPVLIRANSLGEGVPYQDLRVSPEHALYIDGVLVPAVHLVNGTTIVRDLQGDLVEYFHIELEGEHVIFAEGAPAETFVNHNSRRMFQNWEEYVTLYGEDEAAIDENGQFIRAYQCVDSGPRLAAIRERLRGSARSGLERAA
jgi:hypothetical protein